MIELVLEGAVPSKKNNRTHTASGASIPNKKFVQWQTDALKQLRMQTRQRFYVPVQIEVIIYFATLGKADVDNRLTSILDMLTEALVLRDDNWENVPLMKAQAEYRQGKPGAFIRIEELPADFFGADYVVAAEKRDKRNRK